MCINQKMLVHHHWNERRGEYKNVQSCIMVLLSVILLFFFNNESLYFETANNYMLRLGNEHLFFFESHYDGRKYETYCCCATHT